MRGLFVAALIAVVPAGCILGAFQADREDPEDEGSGGEGGGGAASASSSVSASGGASASSASTGGSMAQCQTPADCEPPGSDRCAEATCVDGKCGLKFAPGGLAPGQVQDDCAAVYCDGFGGELSQPDPEDFEDDSNPCTSDMCTPDGTVHPPAFAGKVCPSGTCNGGGHCTPTTCPNLNCGPSHSCMAVHCKETMCQMTPAAPNTPCFDYYQKSSVCDGYGNCIKAP